MSSRSLNKVQLIGNVTRDPELRYTPQGTAVCSIGLATNRSWLPDGSTERREETEFHKLVAWNKLAELCSQLITKGRKIYVEGRLQTRSWETPDGEKRQSTEIVIEDMMLLDARPLGDGTKPEYHAPEKLAAKSDPATHESPQETKDEEATTEPKTESKEEPKAVETKVAETKEAKSDEIDLDDIPF